MGRRKTRDSRLDFVGRKVVDYNGWAEVNVQRVAGSGTVVCTSLEVVWGQVRIVCVMGDQLQRPRTGARVVRAAGC